MLSLCHSLMLEAIGGDVFQRVVIHVAVTIIFRAISLSTCWVQYDMRRIRSYTFIRRISTKNVISVLTMLNTIIWQLLLPHFHIVPSYGEAPKLSVALLKDIMLKKIL